MRRSARKRFSHAMLPVMAVYSFAPNFALLAAEALGKTPIQLAKARRKSKPTANQPDAKAKRSKSLKKDSGGENTSPAANCGGGVSIQVNQRTGGLEVNIKNVILDGVTDDMDVQLGLVKTESNDKEKVPFSLDFPGGWAFSGVDYIDTTDQNEVTLHVNGNQFAVDKNFKSNLRYARSRSRYLDLNARDFPYKHPQGAVEVHYTLMGCEGQNCYFGPNGKLWGRDDRFGNHVLYVYDKKDAKPFQAELREIIDSYGNEIKIDYESNKVIVEMPDKRTAEYAYDWNKRILTVKDLEGLETRLKLDGAGRVVEVEYPTGGESTYAWNAQAIPYKAADGSKQYFPAVVEVEHYPGKGSASPPMTEEYRYGLDGRYFTYWDHPFQTSNGGDGLMESEDNTYTYTNRRILKGGPGKADDVWEDTTCNFLNLPIETAAYQGGKLMDSSIIHYEGETETSKMQPLSDSHKFQPLHDLPPNYSEPCSEAALFHGKSGKPRVSLTLTEFNDYGLTTKVTNYTSRDGNVGEEHVTSVTTTDHYLPDEKSPFDYAKGFCQTRTEEVRDLVSKNVTRTTNTLSDDWTYVKSSTLSMARSGGKNAADGKTSSSSMDGSGRLTSRELRFTNVKVPGNEGQPTAAESKLSYDQNGGLLTISKRDIGASSDGDRLSKRVIDVTNGRLKSETDALGRKTTLSYNDKNKTERTTYPDGSWVEVRESDPRVTVTEHSTGLVEKQYKDGFGRVVKETDNLGPERSEERTLGTYKYDGFGRLSEETDLYGHVTTHAYDYQGREIKVVDERLGVVLETEYDDVAMTSIEFLSIKSGAGERVKLSITHYNSDGGVIGRESFLTEDGGGVRAKNKVEYDGLGREFKSALIQIAEGGGEETIMRTESSYTIDGEIDSYELTTRDGASATGEWERSLLGNTTTKTLTFHSIPPGVRKPNGPSLSETIIYNRFGDVAKRINQKGQAISYEYDKNGNLKTMIDFAGVKTTYEYDDMDRMTLMTCGDIQQKNEYVDGAAKSLAAGQLKSRTLIVKGQEKDRIVYDYDDRGLVSSVTRNGKTMKMTYDAVMRLKTLTDFAGVTTTYEYYGENRDGVPNDNLKTASNPYGSATFSYYTRTNGALFGAGTSPRETTFRDPKSKTVATIKYDYYGLVKPESNDGRDERTPKLRGVEMFDATGKLLSGSSYEYERGQIKTVTRTSRTAPDDLNRNNVKVYTYNDLGLLIREDLYGPDCESQLLATEYEYDINDNVVERTIKDGKGEIVENNQYGYNEIDQLVALNKRAGKDEKIGERFDYDANGNLVMVRGGDGKDAWLEKLDYNAVNQMIRYRDKRTGLDVSYDYDAESLRKVKRLTNDPKRKIEFFHVDDDVINERDGANSMTSYLLAGGTRALRALDGETQMWYVHDAKDVVGCADPSGSKQTETYNYSPYGKRTDLNQTVQHNQSESGSEFSIKANPFGYNGEYLDSESGLVYLRARYYSPKLMRFTSRDTYDVSNRYAYGDGDPINTIDPNGHNALSFTLAIASLVTSITATVLTFGAAAPSAVGAVMAVATAGMGIYGSTMEGIKNTQEEAWNDWAWRDEDTFANVMSVASMGIDVGSGAFAIKSIRQAGWGRGGARSMTAAGGKLGAGENASMLTNPSIHNPSISGSSIRNPSMNNSSLVGERASRWQSFTEADNFSKQGGPRLGRNTFSGSVGADVTEDLNVFKRNGAFTESGAGDIDLISQRSFGSENIRLTGLEDRRLLATPAPTLSFFGAAITEMPSPLECARKLRMIRFYTSAAKMKLQHDLK